jgi:drug/metabolite transporter (DMT)-like permease
MFAQKYLHPASVALVMSLESVFAVLSGWIFLNEVLTVRELAGCAVILIAVIMAQLPEFGWCKPGNSGAGKKL